MVFCNRAIRVEILGSSLKTGITILSLFLAACDGITYPYARFSSEAATSMCNVKSVFECHLTHFQVKYGLTFSDLFF